MEGLGLSELYAMLIDIANEETGKTFKVISISLNNNTFPFYF